MWMKKFIWKNESETYLDAHPSKLCFYNWEFKCIMQLNTMIISLVEQPNDTSRPFWKSIDEIWSPRDLLWWKHFQSILHWLKLRILRVTENHLEGSILSNYSQSWTVGFVVREWEHWKISLFTWFSDQHQQYDFLHERLSEIWICSLAASWAASLLRLMVTTWLH